MHSRVLLLSFDALDLRDLQKGTAEGWLPAMAGFVERGRTVLLDGYQDILGDATWPTLLTGTMPDAHGLLWDWQLDPERQRIAHTSSDALRQPPFWRFVSDAGLRSVVVGMHGAPIVENFRGVQLVGWGPFDPWATPFAGPVSDPPGLLSWIEDQVGKRSVQHWLEPPKTTQQALSFCDQLIAGVRQQVAALKLLSKGEDWDFFGSMIGEGHIAGHFLWRLANGSELDPAEEGDPAVRDRFRRVLRDIDAGIGEIAALVGPDTDVLVTSASGMGANPNVQDALPEVLERAGLLARTTAGAPADRRLRILARGRTLIRNLVPPSLRPFLGRLVPRNRWLAELMLADVDWSRTRAFALPMDSSGLVRINLRGRDPYGVVSPGTEYDRLCDQLVSMLGGIREAGSDRPVVTRAVRTDQLLGTPVTGPLPDVCVGWRAGREVGQVMVPGLGTVDVPPPEIRFGVHRPPGFVVAAGPGVDPQDGYDQVAANEDLAPTVLHMLGVPIPDHLPGQPIPGLPGAVTSSG